MDYFGSVGSPPGIYATNHSIGVDLTEDRVPSRHFDGKVNKSIHENIQQKLRESLNELRQKEQLKQGMTSSSVVPSTSQDIQTTAVTSTTAATPTTTVTPTAQQPMTLQSFLSSNTDTLLLFMLFVVIILSFVQHIQIQHLSGKVDLLLMKNMGQPIKTG